MLENCEEAGQLVVSPIISEAINLLKNDAPHCHQNIEELIDTIQFDLSVIMTKAQDDFRRCFLSRQRRAASSRENTAQSSSNDDDDPMDVERNAIWSELTSSNGGKFPQSLGLDIQDGDSLDSPAGGFTKFHRLCSLPRNGPLDPLWENVRKYLKDLPPDLMEEKLTTTQKDGFNFTPLHVVCFLSPPLDVVELMIELCPESVQTKTEHGDSPLGLACGGFVPAGADVIEFLADAYPEARDEANLREETPLHIHLKIMRKYELDPCPIVVGLLATVQAVNTRDFKEHSPLYYLARAATDAFSLLSACVRFFAAEDINPPDFDAYKKCLGTIVNNGPGRSSKTLFLRDLLQLPKGLRDASFEKQNTREVINNIVGRGQYIALLMMDFYVQLAIVISYTLGCSNGFQNKSYTTVMFVGSAYWLLKRLVSALGSSEHWTKINGFHMTTIIQAATLLASAIHLRSNEINLSEEGESGPWRNILIVNAALIWFTIMGIVCHTLKGFSVFVHATIQIFKRLVNLFLVFVVIFMAFSTMFFLSATDSEYCAFDADSGEHSGDYCTLNDSFQKVYSLFFGTLEADDFNVPSPTLVTLFFFNVIVVILLLNIIIAVMSDCYAEVNDSAELVFWDHRFELIVDVDAISYSITKLLCCFTKREKKPEVTDDEENDVGAVSHDWFNHLIHNKANSNIPRTLYNLYIIIAMALWFLVGLCTFGLTWPRHARRKIFAPSVTDHLAEDDNQLYVDSERIRMENEILERENAELNKENEELRRQLDKFQLNTHGGPDGPLLRPHTHESSSTTSFTLNVKQQSAVSGLEISGF